MMVKKSQPVVKSTSPWIAGLLLAGMLLLNACQTAEIADTGASGSRENAAQMDETEALLNVSNHPELGQILTGKDGMTLYIFTNDGPNQSNCSGDCLVNWPPLITEGNPQMGQGVDPSLVGTADMADGSKIVTYNSRPLYYWAADQQPGDATGQGVGGVWFVVDANGNPVGQ